MTLGMCIVLLAFARLLWSLRRRWRDVRTLGIPLQPGAMVVPALGELALFLAIVVTAAALSLEEDRSRSTAMGMDVVFVLDVSKSMRAQDVAPDRFVRAVSEVSRLLGTIAVRSHEKGLGALKTPGGVRVGLVAFAGRARLVCPLTDGLETARLFLGGVRVPEGPAGGTDLVGGLERALQVHRRSVQRWGNSHRREIVLFSDGESIDDSVDAVLSEASRLGVRIHTVGMGTSDGAPIPGIQGEWVVDEEGRVVRSRLDAARLQRISRGTGGVAFGGGEGRSLSIEEIFGGWGSTRVDESSADPMMRLVLILLACLLFSSLGGFFHVGVRQVRLQLAVLTLSSGLLIGAAARLDSDLGSGDRSSDEERLAAEFRRAIENTQGVERARVLAAMAQRATARGRLEEAFEAIREARQIASGDPEVERIGASLDELRRQLQQSGEGFSVKPSRSERLRDVLASLLFRVDRLLEEAGSGGRALLALMVQSEQLGQGIRSIRKDPVGVGLVGEEWNRSLERVATMLDAVALESAREELVKLILQVDPPVQSPAIKNGIPTAESDPGKDEELDRVRRYEVEVRRRVEEGRFVLEEAGDAGDW